MNEESIFAELLRRSPGPERDAYLVEACQNNATMRQRLERLLVHHEESNDFLNQVIDHKRMVGSTVSTTAVNPTGTQEIGSYRLLHLLGEGGMGSVYLAEQSVPIKRRVAIKIIKPGMNSDQYIARFEAERQALAMMDHPSIAKVFDAGCTSNGLPFFVMELVKGVPITEFCESNRLGTVDRLTLFIQVCKAVQHAHQKGIIHRDLKPSNVMVAMYDDRPVPKVIDFGVAKATHQPLTEQTLYTIPGQIVGTWEYMSPEQAILNQLDVDTRTDIYSLGVILYELLTGETPLDLKSLRPEALEERLRRIREEEPSRPSLKVSSLKPGDGARKVASLSAYRGSDVFAIARSLRGDLDWIVMKAIEKNRSKRFETANGFAAELQRYLNDEPISFRPPSTLEQVRRLYRRNRVATNMLTIAIVSLALGLVLAMVSRNEAVLQKVEADTANQRLESEKEEKDALLNSLAVELIEKAFIHAQNDDEANMEESLESALDAGAPSVWRDILRGQLCLYGKNPAEAITLLEAAVQKDKANATAHGLLTTAYIFNGDYLEFLERNSAEYKVEPSDEFDQLFSGAALIMIDDPAALGLVQAATGTRLMPMGLAIEAQSLGHVALDQGDKTLARDAIRKIQAARVFLPDNRFIRMMEVSIHHTCFNLGVEGIDTRRVKEVIESAGDMEDYSIGHFVNGLTYEDLGLLDAAEESLIASANSGSWWGSYDWLLCSQQRFEEAQAFLSSFEVSTQRGQEFKASSKDVLSLIDGKVELRPVVYRTASRLHKAALESPNSNVANFMDSHGIEALLFAGMVDEAVAFARESNTEFHLQREIAPICLLVDEQSPEIQAIIEGSNAAKVLVYYTYGLLELARGHVDKASAYFDRARKSKFFFSEYYAKSLAMKKLIDDGYAFPSMLSPVERLSVSGASDE